MSRLGWYSGGFTISYLLANGRYMFGRNHNVLLSHHFIALEASRSRNGAITIYLGSVAPTGNYAAFRGEYFA